MTTTTLSKIPSSLAKLSIQQLFQIWQDLTNEATGHDTEWGYPITLDCIVQELKSTRHHLIQQLIQQSFPPLELLSQNAALTFHYPI